MTNQSRSFYRLLGPFLARREVVAEVGGPIWDEDDKTWFVALADGVVVGFCAARESGSVVTLQSAYVVPGYRRSGVYRALFADRLAWLGDRPARAVCTEASLPAFLDTGFTEARTRGRFTEVRRG
ncbi:GNAT family N-acetyltransferase [Dactylosporangium roseum]|uniref:GNAT family N-acetyltransferase n=1 Tax=Dactylosporangium roseum TaxID=47989 RepID=A0ABY5Z9Y5_9ACTN|nr:GNAT family N-acetyltransferase [Dactylosporangium roseum]UWZ37800.1 GNAT family N-acetyltransferase [Dactylosporangium roseum]